MPLVHCLGRPDRRCADRSCLLALRFAWRAGSFVSWRRCRALAAFWPPASLSEDAPTLRCWKGPRGGMYCNLYMCVHDIFDQVLATNWRLTCTWRRITWCIFAGAELQSWVLDLAWVRVWPGESKTVYHGDRTWCFRPTRCLGHRCSYIFSRNCAR